jgi:exosortase C (VPDSG-CTERM-specific)
MPPEVQNAAPPQPAQPIENASRAPLDRNARRRLFGLGIFTLVLCIFFIRPIRELIHVALDKDRQSYLLLVPAICGYLIWIKRRDLHARFLTSTGAALVLTGIGLAMLLIARSIVWTYPADRLSLQIFSLLCFFWAGCYVFLGGSFIRQLFFPFAFLVFMIPVPTQAVDYIEIFLQYASADAAYWMLSLTDVPMLRTGLDFVLPGIPIRVAQECSGYNSTFSLFMVSLVAGHLFLNSPGRKTILALFVIPLAILRNGFRIMTIALLCVYVDPSMIDSYIHHKGGPIFFALSLVPFLLLMWGLRKAEIVKSRKQVNSRENATS